MSIFDKCVCEICGRRYREEYYDATGRHICPLCMGKKSNANVEIEDLRFEKWSLEK